MFKRIALLAPGALLALPAAAAARPEAISSSSGLKVFFGLALVLGAIGALAWGFRKFGGPLGPRDGAMRVIAGLSLGARERAVLVQVGNRQILLGVAPGRVQTLHVLETPVATSPAPALMSDSFAARLASALRQQVRR
jgi:flagellar protein FliO/FliZ